MKHAPFFLSSLLVGALSFGCAKDDAKSDTKTTNPNPSGAESGSDTSATGAGGTTDGDVTDASATGPGEPGTTTTPVTDGGGDTDCNFICPDSDTGGITECDNWAQDCPDGQKCTAWASSGGTWDAVKCVDVTGMHVAGDPCTSEGAASGIDSCEKGAMCWGVSEGVGTCVALCTGTPDSSFCGAPNICTIANMGSLNLCLANCDPLVQDCANAAEVCYPINDNFTCAPDASGDAGMFGDPCEFINVCDKGLACLNTEFVGSSCQAGSTGCCSPFCEFPGGACPGADQSCVQWFDPMQLPANDPLLDIGVCGIPE